MLVHRALKIRIYPNKEQQSLVNKTLGCCRFIYNQMLHERITAYDRLKDDKTKLYGHKYRTEKQYKEEFGFLKDADAVALQQARINLENAYNNFYKSLKGLRKGEKTGFPKFKSKKNRESFRTFRIKIDFDKNTVKIPKCGEIGFRHDRIRDFYKKAALKNGTLTKTPSGKYFMSILFEHEVKPREHADCEGKVTGLDMSLQNFYVDSSGNSPDFQRNYRKNEKKLATKQKRLGTKTKGSNNYNKQRIKIAKIHERISNKRRDFNHKISFELVKNNDVIVVESLNLKGMSRCLNLGKSVLDLGYGDFISKLKYKAEENSKEIVFADRWFASSKTCSVCGTKNRDLLLHERTWECKCCGNILRRDMNAAINLRNLGLRSARPEPVKTSVEDNLAERLHLKRLS